MTFSFPKVKAQMRGKQFSSPNDEAVAFYLDLCNSLSLNDYFMCYKSWFERINKCIECGGEWFEKK